MSLVSVRNLKVEYGSMSILRGLDFELIPGETLGIVGESGCGKSMTGLALMGMVPSPGRVSGSIDFAGTELIGLHAKKWQELRGDQIAMVMQDPFTSLNPVIRIGDQVAEVFQLHRKMSKSEARQAAIELLNDVGIPDPAASARKFPHQLSGGQRQRVVIACAFAGSPKVLIADEPTTALDVTLQAQVLDLLQELQKRNGTAVMLISHDIGVIANYCQRIAVFYAGEIVEMGSVDDVLRDPKHPYTQALLNAIPRVGVDILETIPGQPPRFTELPEGCAFHPRCSHKFAPCTQHPSNIQVSEAHKVACWLYAEAAQSTSVE